MGKLTDECVDFRCGGLRNFAVARSSALELIDCMAAASVIVACHECDFMQRIPAADPGDSLACVRCGAHLRRLTRNGRQRIFPLTLAAALLFALTIATPIIGLQVGGRSSSASIIEAADALLTEGMAPIAALLVLTTLVFPLFDLAVLAMSALDLRVRADPRRLTTALRLMQTLRRWGMVEIFMLGVLVSSVKLAALAAITPGIGLWTLGAYLALVAAAHASFDGWDYWAGRSTAS